MQKSLIGFLLGGLVLGFVAYVAFGGSWAGGYAYTCADGTEFRVLPSEDFESLTVTPTKNAAIFPQKTFEQVDSNIGKMYVGGNVVLFGKGESLQLVTTSSSTVCTPVQSGEAPINFGD